MEIKVKELVEGLYTNVVDEDFNLISFVQPGSDCIDLRAAEDYEFLAPQAGILHQKDGVKTRDVKFDEKLIKLGIAMELPKGFSAIICQRSSTTKKLRLVMASSGYIDNSYKGDDDEWGFYCYALDKTKINKGDRICQFRIVPNQFATPWQKIKWLFSSINFKFVPALNNESRGGHGSTGVK